MVKTVTGRVYILIGKMNLHVDSGEKADLKNPPVFLCKCFSSIFILLIPLFWQADFPRWFLKKFLSGFPLIWKEVYEKFLSESRM